MDDGIRPPSPPPAAAWQVPHAADEQPPLLPLAPVTLNAAIGSLALGGAERIVLDWAAAAAHRQRVRLLVLRAAPASWSVPANVAVIRPDGDQPPEQALVEQGRAIAATGNRRVLCHLLTAGERCALADGGADPVPVLHNARAGWIEDGSHYARPPEVIAVSAAAAAELRALGARPTVLRHFPRPPRGAADARRAWRKRWAVPEHDLLIGMIGGVKPQKAYTRAIRILAELCGRRTAYLVILGGPVGRDGLTAWQAAIDQARYLGVAAWLRMPGFTPDAARALPAFDLLLNTSRYEGVSIATMEALAAGLPVVASDVGGQAEIAQPGLRLLPFAAPVATWCDAIEAAAGAAPARPAWSSFPSPRLWTLHHLDVPRRRGPRVLFVTANLNAGGAQRSLVNLARMLHPRLPLEIAVCGDSSVTDFFLQLKEAGVAVFRTAAGRDCFDHAEALLQRLAGGDIGALVFWNVDPKVKLLLAQRLAHAPVRLIDVSPGAYAFEEMDATADFQRCIAHRSADYYARLDRLVLKYRTAAPVRARTACIPNGVPLPRHSREPGGPARKVVVSGRIAPSKFLLEIVAAMRIVWTTVPDATLHLLGTTEPRQRAYAEQVIAAAGAELGRRVLIHGPAFDVPEQLAGFDLALVIGRHQGSPNAVLEAMAAGLAIVANDSGGTRELVLDGRTGLLLPDHAPSTIARALLRLMDDDRLTARLAGKGRAHVGRHYSMARMAAAYRRLLER